MNITKTCSSYTLKFTELQHCYLTGNDPNGKKHHEILVSWLINLKGLLAVDYLKTNAPYIYLSIETEHDNQQTWSDIKTTINRALDFAEWDYLMAKLD